MKVAMTLVHTTTTKAYLSALHNWIGMISFRGIVDNDIYNVIAFCVEEKFGHVFLYKFY